MTMRKILTTLKLTNRRLSFKIMLAVVTVIILVNGVLFWFIGHRYNRLLDGNLLDISRTMYKQIVIMRSYVAQHGGIYVPFNEQDQLNPFLQNPLLVTQSGDTLIQKNPAAVTRDLSELSPMVGGKYQFHLTSLNLVNPDNRPDEFERAALLALENPEDRHLTQYGEYTAQEKVNGESRFRYFAPLFTKKSCLSCHGDQGYEVGDVRGGMSISFSTASIDAAKNNNIILMIVGGLFTSGLISVLIYSMMYKNVIDPVQQLESAAERIGKGDFDSHIPVQSDDEIGDLARVLKQMQSEIKITMNKQVEYEKMYALGQLSSGIAHEIRNPLFAVRNNIDYLERNYTPSDDQVEVYRDIDDGLSRVSRIINSVLDYSRPHSMEFDKRDVADLLDRTMALMGKQLEKENVSVELEIEEGIPQIEMDIHRLEQVLINLITNAMSAMEDAGGDIRIQAEQKNKTVQIVVQDTGCGMKEDQIRHIFDPFYTRSRGGTGLGLTIVHRIIEQHNGSIRVKSTEGIGTKFILTLPITQTEVEHDEI
ncbi:MAG: DUF3365 domain-containing protein [Candidatus Marinimicrobia bacterium]|nr:DUF3365 domain-containing protein [Candidatus Neomarinimicrobiota bacterium]